mmetsp:Transcript_29228/g.33404  ORF Transcript_29228/g.33404 Transcript_29228/m.33404 type:complete len:323 (+) Transcript_29228:1-969(+)
MTLIVSGMVFLYVILALARFVDRKVYGGTKIPEFPLKMFEYYIHLIVMIGYIPIITSLLDSFACDIQATVNGKTNYYLSRDCNTRCGSDEQQTLMIFAGLALLLFVPVATFQRVRLQVDTKELNILQRPLFLLSKTTLIISLIIVQKLFVNDPATHSLIDLIILTAYCFIIKEKEVVNVAGVQIFQKALLAGVLCEFLTTMVSHVLVYLHTTIFFILLTTGWLTILMAALVMARGLPKVIYTGRHHSSPIALLVRTYFANQEPMTEEILIQAMSKVAYKEYGMVDADAGKEPFWNESLFTPVHRFNPQKKKIPVQKRNTLAT